MKMEDDAFPAGVKLVRTELGGLAVIWEDNFIGWIHASIGDKWNAYARGQRTGDSGILLGRFSKKAAVQRIALEAGWRETE